MRNLSKSELDRIHGGLLRQAVASSLHPELGGNPPPSPVAGVPQDGTVKLTPLFNNLGQTDGLNTQWGNINDLSISQKSVAFKTDLLSGVDTQLMHELGTSTTTLKATLPDIDGSGLSFSSDFGTNDAPTGAGVTITANGGSATLGFGTGGFTAGGGFSVGGFTGKASFNFSTDTLSISGSLPSFGSIQCSFNASLGGGGGGGSAGILCYKTGVSQEIVGGPAPITLNQHVDSGQHLAIA